jgi:hypothetical protein
MERVDEENNIHMRWLIATAVTARLKQELSCSLGGREGRYNPNLMIHFHKIESWQRDEETGFKVMPVLKFK